MKTIKMKDGLGNQISQYAFGIYISARNVFTQRLDFNLIMHVI